MSPDAFDHLAQLLQPVIHKQKTPTFDNLCEGKVSSYTLLSNVR